MPSRPRRGSLTVQLWDDEAPRAYDRVSGVPDELDIRPTPFPPARPVPADPRVAIASQWPISTTSFGAAWFDIIVS